ncbi:MULTISPECIES: YjzD family protein [unclassified Virgibacillus]|uniref:YjzD family protein n=1 Tax=unclassified Virgibacillus TaxID=2620237 RepID=UPI0024DE42A2|nr:YjzD family protein [Virgibacillus sp. LDC-1]
MRYIWTIIWAMLISGVLSYVLSSMAANPFVLKDTLILGAIFAIFIFILGEGVLREEKSN